MRARDGTLLALAGLIAALPLLWPLGHDRTFGGTDDRAAAAVGELAPDYRPWVEAPWRPSPEMASFLFAAQAALGAGVLGYCLGRRRGESQARREAAGDEDD